MNENFMKKLAAMLSDEAKHQLERRVTEQWLTKVAMLGAALDLPDDHPLVNELFALYKSAAKREFQLILEINEKSEEIVKKILADKKENEIVKPTEAAMH
jgi:hypothetical protein